MRVVATKLSSWSRPSGSPMRPSETAPASTPLEGYVVTHCTVARLMADSGSTPYRRRARRFR